MAPPLRLRVSRSNSHLRRALSKVTLVAAAPIQVETAPSLTAYRGRLLTAEARGTPVHAASFIRQRRIILESQLLTRPAALQAIFLHELFHFAWRRMGNPQRLSFTEVISYEVSRRAAGEIAESATVAKARWRSKPTSTALWKNYVCEAFCDTAAFLYSQRPKTPEMAAHWLTRRRAWFVLNRPPDGWPC